MRKKDYTMQVYADAIGQALQVGWQMSVYEVGGMMANTRFGQSIQQSEFRHAGDPNVQRQLNGLVQAFQQTVFLPTLEDLVNAMAQSQQKTGGFFNA